MNLLEIREWLIRESGRYELVTDTTSWADNGADRYINAGVRMLDRMLATPLAEGINLQKAATGAKHIVFPTCRAIKAVFAIKISDYERTELEKKENNYIRELTFDTDIDAGTPLYYAPGIFRHAPEIQAPGDIPMDLYDPMIGAKPYDYNGIVFSPATDEDYVMEIQGQFYSQELSSDTDENYWSSRHPELTVMAAQCVMEKFNRNTEGVKDWTAAIQMELSGIDKDMAEEEAIDITELGG